MVKPAQDILVGLARPPTLLVNTSTAQDILVGLIGDHQGCGGLGGRSLINDQLRHIYDDVLFIVVGPAFLNDWTNASVQVFC